MLAGGKPLRYYTHKSKQNRVNEMVKFPIENMTELEQKVIVEIAIQCEEYSACINDICKNTGLSPSTVKGVLGSLVKKGFAATEGRDVDGSGLFHDIFLTIDGVFVSFDDENGELSDDQKKLFDKLKDWKF